MGVHLVAVDGVLTFKSDKYQECPAGKVPLSVKDPDAQPLLWEYAQLHRKKDPEFSDDLETALRNAGFVPSAAVCFMCRPVMDGTTANASVRPMTKCSECGAICSGGHWIVKEK